MKRPLLVTVLAVLESLFGSASLGFGIYLLKLSFMTGMKASEISGDRIAGAIFGIFGAVWIVLAVLVFLGSRWGWWLGCALNLFAAIVLSFDTAGEWRQAGADDIGLAATFVVLTILYLLPSVRRYRRLKLSEIARTEITSPANV